MDDEEALTMSQGASSHNLEDEESARIDCRGMGRMFGQDIINTLNRNDINAQQTLEVTKTLQKNSRTATTKCLSSKYNQREQLY